VQARILDVSEVAAIRAAGGIICRPGPAGLLEVAVVHRPGYDDWTFPKGKLEFRETAEAAALREVNEETGFECELGESLGCTAYVDRRGRDKTVCYWRMRVRSGRFVPNFEVDELRWLTLVEAAGLLTFARDREILGLLD